jgi:diguanylate cyclase (GGDEF)-like protein/PAS domain S-box-containing protein
MATKKPLKRFKKPLPVTAMLTVAAGFLGTALLFKTVSNLETEKISADFEQRAAARIAAIGQSLMKVEESLRTVNLLFEANDTVTRAEFATLTRRLIDRTPYVQSFSFQRILSSAQRAEYERAMRREFPDFSIQQWANGIRSAVGMQDSYRVIDYIEPARQNKGAFGLDTSGSIVLADAVQRARDTGLPSMTNLLMLPQGKPSPDGVVIFMPIYRHDASLENVAMRRAQITGFTTVAFKAGEMVRQTLVAAGMLNRSGLAVSVYVGDYRTEQDLVFRHDDAPSATVLSARPRFALYPALPEISQSIELAGKPWHIAISSTSNAFLVNRLGSLLTLLAGILATLLGAANLQRFATRTRRTERLVEERTDELQQSNALLTTELAARKDVEHALLLRERAIESSANAIIISSALAPDYPIIYVNPAFERITGYHPSDVIGKSCRFLRGDDHTQTGLEEIRAALRDRREGRALLRNYRKDGTLFWNDLHLSPVKNADGLVTHFVAAQYDITELKRYQLELEIQANRDMLTGLANRNLLQDRLKKAIAHAARYRSSIWVLVFDIDRFKLINDTLGQKAGDVVLKTIAGRLKSSAREIDTVARFGADEFALVLPQQANVAMSTDIVQRVMNAVSEYIMIGDRELHITSSVGIAIYPADGDDAEALLTHAGIAMYRAKDSARNTFQFYRPAMNEQALDRLRIEEELHSALERGEFLLHYQPQVDLATGKIVGMEALIRWLHPTLGMVSPLNFIGVAEDTGLIVPIGEWVVRTACLQNKAWENAGLGTLRVAVNLSARQFAQPDLVAMIADVLQETGLDAHCLEIELTESLIMTDVQQAVLTLQQLKDLGVLLSVDDFGTGYSSLSYLKRFPIDTLKIDQAFVQDITTDADDAVIVNAIISLAHNLQLTVIAEGVETEAQLDYLRRQGCDEIQGYYFSRPVPADAFELLLRNRTGLAVL